MFQLKKSEKMMIKGILIFCFFWFSAYLQLIPVKLFHLNTTNLSTGMKVILSTFSSFITFFVLFFVYRKDLKKEFNIFRKNLVENMDIGFRYWMVGLILMMVFNMIITFVLKAGGANNEKTIQDMIHSLPMFMLLEAGVLAPFNEEIVFRKTLYDIMGKYKWLFMIASFLLFGGAHVIGSAKVWTDYLYIIPYGVLGASFALAYHKTNTIFTSLSMHMIHNTILTVLSIIAL